MSGIGGMSFSMVIAPTLGAAQTELRESPSGSNPAGSNPAGSNPAVDDFLAYMKKSLAERMADAWLASHGLDRDKLKAMSAEKREAILKQMAEELTLQLKQAAAEKAGRKPEAA